SGNAWASRCARWETNSNKLTQTSTFRHCHWCNTSPWTEQISISSTFGRKLVGAGGGTTAAAVVSGAGAAKRSMAIGSPVSASMSTTSSPSAGAAVSAGGADAAWFGVAWSEVAWSDAAWSDAAWSD